MLVVVGRFQKVVTHIIIYARRMFQKVNLDEVGTCGMNIYQAADRKIMNASSSRRYIFSWAREWLVVASDTVICSIIIWILRTPPPPIPIYVLSNLICFWYWWTWIFIVLHPSALLNAREKCEVWFPCINYFSWLNKCKCQFMCVVKLVIGAFFSAPRFHSYVGVSLGWIEYFLKDDNKII